MENPILKEDTSKPGKSTDFLGPENQEFSGKPLGVLDNCPIQEIDVKQDRRIIYCDNLTFPWNQDPNGYFLVKIEKDILYCGFVTHDTKMILELRGKNPDKIIKEIVKRDLCSKGNIGYISSELMIAYNCIKNNLPYVQR